MHLNKFPNSQHSCDSCCNLLGKCQLIQPKLEAPWHPSEVLCQAASLRLHPKSAEPLRNCPQSKYGTPTNHQLNTIVVELLKPLKYLISGSYKFMSCKSAPSQAFLSFSHCAVALHMCCGNQPNLPGTLWPNLCDSDSHSGGSNKQSQTHMPIELNWLSHTFFFFLSLFLSCWNMNKQKSQTPLSTLFLARVFFQNHLEPAKHLPNLLQDLHLLIFQWSWVL